jgi:hypothetical protein
MFPIASRQHSGLLKICDMKREVITLNERRKLERFNLRIPAKIEGLGRKRGFTTCSQGISLLEVLF